MSKKAMAALIPMDQPEFSKLDVERMFAQVAGEDIHGLLDYFLRTDIAPRLLPEASLEIIQRCANSIEVLSQNERDSIYADAMADAEDRFSENELEMLDRIETLEEQRDDAMASRSRIHVDMMVQRHRAESAEVSCRQILRTLQWWRHDGIDKISFSLALVNMHGQIVRIAKNGIKNNA